MVLFYGRANSPAAVSSSDRVNKRAASIFNKRKKAAKKVADENPTCVAIAPFYWEVGTKDGVIVGESTGDQSVSSSTRMAIASATKWLFGAYVLQSRVGVLSADDVAALNMNSGYISMNNLNCLLSTTVSNCFSNASNSDYTSSANGRFNYGSGHFQKWGHENGLGNLSKVDLASEFMNKLGYDLDLSWNTAVLAAGVSMSPGNYGIFLQRILSGDYYISPLLGENSICTLPSTCASSDYSPAPESWHYSYGHWVEDDPVSGDGSFSSAGAFGFYPWIDASKTYYGLIGRHSNDNDASLNSAICGREIRRAFLEN